MCFVSFSINLVNNYYVLGSVLTLGIQKWNNKYLTVVKLIFIFVDVGRHIYKFSWSMKFTNCCKIQKHGQKNKISVVGWWTLWLGYLQKAMWAKEGITDFH